MPRKRTPCKECNKICFSLSGYCRKHSPFTARYVRTEQHRKRLSEIFKGRQVPWIKGKKLQGQSERLKKWWNEHPEEREKRRQKGLLLASDKAYLQKLSQLLSGENNPAWKGGIAQKKYRGFYQKLKDKIRERDNYICQLCGQTETSLGYTMSINHINFNKEDSREENLNCLCKRCNSLINFKREKWTIYFQQRFVNMTGHG